jgi:hypothetical protein
LKKIKDKFTASILKSSENKRLKEKYEAYDNIHVLDGVDFSNSANKQIHESDIVLLLESTFDYSNILLEKSPFVTSLEKPVLALLPEVCELRNIIKNEKYIVKSYDIEYVINKVEALFVKTLDSNETVYPFGTYFNNENFKQILGKVLTGFKYK